MNFRRKKIEENRDTHIPEKKARIYSGKKVSVSLSLSASIIIIFLLFFGIYKTLRSIDFQVFLKVAGDELQADAYDHTNFLILGTGGKFHDGGNLTDTIIVASIDSESKLVSMVSIPRDLYVRDPEVGDSRINEIYYKSREHYESSYQGLDHMAEKVEVIMGIPIHYWIKVDFKGFTELVDALGGIDVNVETAIHDPYYPKDGTYEFETFNIAAGEQHMDGSTALKFARSRKTTSDFDRAHRQQQIIYAIKEQALRSKTILNAGRIDKILTTLSENIETNITVKEILTLGAIAADFSANQISHRLIHDDPAQCGGFLYPPVRELYEGQFVLVPAGDFEFIHLYSDLIFNSPSIAKEGAKIQVLNGTAEGGIAGENKNILNRFCLDVIRFGNARANNIQKTTYYYRPGVDGARPETLNFLQKIIPGDESTIIPQDYIEAGYTEADILIEIGADYVKSKNYLADPFKYIFEMVSHDEVESDEN